MTCKPKAKGKKGSIVSFTLKMCPTISKGNFLLDPLNKQQFIDLLRQKLKAAECFMLPPMQTSWLSKKLLKPQPFPCPQAKKDARQQIRDIQHAKFDLGLFTYKSHVLFLQCFVEFWYNLKTAWSWKNSKLIPAYNKLQMYLIRYFLVQLRLNQQVRMLLWQCIVGRKMTPLTIHTW